jgi:hypothetical protein
MKIKQKSFVKPEPESRNPFLSKWMVFSISTPPLYYAGSKINSDPKPCKGLDKAVIKMTEYE